MVFAVLFTVFFSCSRNIYCKVKLQGNCFIGTMFVSSSLNVTENLFLPPLNIMASVFSWASTSPCSSIHFPFVRRNGLFSFSAMVRATSSEQATIPHLSSNSSLSTSSYGTFHRVGPRTEPCSGDFYLFVLAYVNTHIG